MFSSGKHYPLTNPVNPILAEFRRCDAEYWVPDGVPRIDSAAAWLELWKGDPGMWSRVNWGDFALSDSAHIEHARRVLARFVALHGGEEEEK